uniref:Carbonic anhydrase n=1 Tax=Timspurckia oligopyrenoides TaxID=708627 RepID=A0A6T6MJ81_9RHOD|mmetsp:Transcript_3673/g.6442  ORF Transcript_3673/g.6442 Transcript_3673/m.6442 type:complete len:296 (+) Transcript_3673:123-1010(+)
MDSSAFVSGVGVTSFSKSVGVNKCQVSRSAGATIRCGEKETLRDQLQERMVKLQQALTVQKEQVEVLERISQAEGHPLISSEGDERVAALLKQNREWRESVLKEDPTFFDKLANVQTPEILWIGCADSRVPANEIFNLPPGEVFVHRNIANCVIHTDLSCLSVIEYAVKYLKVKRIVVCGHYNCGGVKASMSSLKYGVIDNWLRHIRDVRRTHFTELSKITDEEAQFRRMCELNAIESMHSVCSTTIVQSAWDEGQELTVHAFIYDLADGLLKDLGLAVSNAEALGGVYRTDASA